jgi:hypothetical protein
MISIWEEGTDLSHAVSIFASETAKIREKAGKLALDNPTKALELAKSIKDEELIASITKTRELGEKYKNYMPMQILQTVGVIASKAGGSIILEDDVLEQIDRKELVGLGYVMPRKTADSPIQIPSDIWSGHIDWSNSTVSGSGLSFVSVRLVENSKILSATSIEQPKAVKVGSPVEPFARTKAGRKSRKEEILVAYEALKAAGVVTLDTPKAILGHEVREFILKDVPKLERRETGLSDETIRRTIRSTK